MSSKIYPKQPRATVQPTGAKEPKVAAVPVSYNHLKACWRVRAIHMADPYGWHELSPEAVGYIQSKLAVFETMTWNEIFVVNKKHNHDIPVVKIRCEKARRWMQRNMPDQTTLWTLRFSGAERVWGIFSEGCISNRLLGPRAFDLSDRTIATLFVCPNRAIRRSFVNITASLVMTMILLFRRVFIYA